MKLGASCIGLALFWSGGDGKLADRSRVVKQRHATGKISRFRDNGRPIEGPLYRATGLEAEHDVAKRYQSDGEQIQRQRLRAQEKPAPWQVFVDSEDDDDYDEIQSGDVEMMEGSPEAFGRHLSSQLSGCCYKYQKYKAYKLCALYGNDCESGETPSHDSGDGDCSQQGLSFIGISFSVNTDNGNPYSYQLCDQFPMENIIDRDYEYVMSMDEDGWLVGGGYKTFDYSGKMPYIDSSHTEVVRIGNMNPAKGGTSIAQVYSAMNSVSFAPFSIFPEYLKGGGGHKSGDNGSNNVQASDVTLIVSVVETYEDSKSYSSYESFLEDLFSALYKVGGGPCMDDHDTDPHVSMARGVKFWSGYHQSQYMYAANLEVAVWQAMYPYGVPIGSSGYAAFPPGGNGKKQKVGYGNLYFFFDRANITKAFSPYRDLSSKEQYYATLYKSSDTSSFYSKTTSVSFNYGGSHDNNNNNNNWKWNPYSWNQMSAKHDMTKGWELPPNCKQEGEAFLGIPLSRASGSKLQSTSTFQEQFDFDYLADRNGTYIISFGTNHGWLIGEELDNAVGSIVDKDTSHIPLFYLGTTNPDMGGLSLSNMIKVVKQIDFGALYIKPAFVFVDSDGHAKLQFEVDMTSALAYLYNNLCKQLGISWNYNHPSNSLKLYTNCAMHAAGDRASYGCGPDGTGSGGFCPQMTLAYRPKFASESAAAAYISRCNNYVDYWRALYPNGVAVGTSSFCKSGGCLGLFLNRLDLYEVFKPDLGGAWVTYNGATMPPTHSPAPTWKGGCDDPHNFILDKCVRKRYKPKKSAVAWDSLGPVGQMSVYFVIFLSITLSLSILLARARTKKKVNQSYFGFLVNDVSRRGRRSKGLEVSDREKGLLSESIEDTLSQSASLRSNRRRKLSLPKKSQFSPAIVQPWRLRKPDDETVASDALKGALDVSVAFVQPERKFGRGSGGDEDLQPSSQNHNDPDPPQIV